MVVFFVVVFVLIGRIPELRITNANDEEFIFVILISILSVAGILLSRFLFTKFTQVISNKEELNEKLSFYQTAMIVRLAIIEGVALFAIVAAMINENLFFLIIALAFLMFFISLHPSKNRVMKEMKIDENQFRNLPDRRHTSNNLS